MKIDLTCPIEITHTEVLTDDRGRCRGYIDIINVSEHPIRMLEGRAVWLSESGAELGEAEVVFEGMRLLPHAHAQLTVAGEIPAAADVSFEAAGASFSDFSHGWSTEDSELVEYDFTPEPPGARRDRLRGIAGPDAVCYPEARGRNWLCVCGRLNAGESHACVRCMRGRERMFVALCDGDSERGGEWNMFSDRLERREQYRARRDAQRRRSMRASRRRRETRTHVALSVLIVLLVAAALLMIGLLLGETIL